MSKYLKEFDAVSEINRLKYTSNYYEPNVYKLNEDIEFNKNEGYLVAKINTSLLSSTSDTLWTTFNGSIFEEVLVDDVKWDNPLVPPKKSDLEEKISNTDLPLEEFLKDDEAISTTKFMGKNVQKYLNSEKIKKLIKLITEEPKEDDHLRGHKFPYVAYEILKLDILYLSYSLISLRAARVS